MATNNFNASYAEWSYGKLQTSGHDRRPLTCFHSLPGQPTYQYPELPNGQHTQKPISMSCYDTQGQYDLPVDHQTHNWNGNTYTDPSYAQHPLPPSPPQDHTLMNSERNLSPKEEKQVKPLRSGNQIPRPRNAFMIFRSEFWAKEKISKTVERDHRLISRIIGNCWQKLTDAEKEPWRQRAEKEKQEHNRKYPGYRFTPGPGNRNRKPIKRKVKRNRKEDLDRCDMISDLILSGKEGAELDNEVQRLGLTVAQEVQRVRSESLSPVQEGSGLPALPAPTSMEPPRTHNSSDRSNSPVFRSPLLPPAELPSSDLQWNIPIPPDARVIVDYNNYENMFSHQNQTEQRCTSVAGPSYSHSILHRQNVSDGWENYNYHYDPSSSYSHVPQQDMHAMTPSPEHYEVPEMSPPLPANPFARRVGLTHSASPPSFGPMRHFHEESYMRRRY